MKAYQVDKEALVRDFVNLAEEKEIEIKAAMELVPSMVDEEMKRMRPEVEQRISQEMKDKIDKKFTEKEDFYKKYIEVIKDEEEGTQNGTGDYQ